MSLGPDNSQNGQSKIYTKQQPQGTSLNGNTITTEQVADVGSVVQQYGLQTLNGQVLPGKIGFTFAPNGVNTCKISIQVQDNGGQPIAGVFDLDIMLAKADGTVTNLTPSTGISVVTGTLLNTYVAGKALYVQTNANGLAEVNNLDTGKQGFNVMVQAGCQPYPAIGGPLVAGNYG